jgi:hypothetical protein
VSNRFSVEQTACLTETVDIAGRQSSLRMENAMKLVKMNDNKIGLLVSLPNGQHVIDIAKSVGVFVPHDPVSSGLLNGIFKDGGDWSLLVKHWAYLRSPLNKLAWVAKVIPDHPNLALRPITPEFQTRGPGDPIIEIDITDIESFEERDPTGRLAMERQFMPTPDSSSLQDAGTVTQGAQVIEFGPLGKGDPIRW